MKTKQRIAELIKYLLEADSDHCEVCAFRQSCNKRMAEDSDFYPETEECVCGIAKHFGLEVC